MKRFRVSINSMKLATTAYAQGVIDVHSHIITSEFVSALEKEGRLLDEGFPLPKYDVDSHLTDYPYVAPQVLTQSLERMKQYLTTEPDLALFVR